MIFPVPRKVFSTKLAAFFSLRIYAIKYVSFICSYIFIIILHFMDISTRIFICLNMCLFPGKDSSKAVVDVEAEIKDAD